MSLSYFYGLVLIPVLSTCGFLVSAYAGPLNDTGIDFLHSQGAGIVAGSDANFVRVPVPGAQDARYGRDAAALQRALQKQGGSAGTRAGRPNGFDFTKVSNVGAMLPEKAALGSEPNGWACTYDNNTGLMWEVKIADATHLRSMGHTYSWYRGDGREGELADGGACHAAGRCDTIKYVQDVNEVGLCGYHDWRLPTPLELANIVDRGRKSPAIDPIYFPNTPATLYWASSAVAGLRGVGWLRNFQNGGGAFELMDEPHSIRLVRKSK